MTEPVLEPAAPRSLMEQLAADDGDHELRALIPAEIDARRRPGAILAVWIFQLLSAFLLTAPVHAWARRVVGTHPDGDAVLSRPGGHMLLAWLDDGADASLAVLARTAIVTLVLYALVGQLVTGALVHALSTGIGTRGRAPAVTASLRAGIAAFAATAIVTVVTTAVEAFLLGLGWALGGSTESGLDARLGEVHAFYAGTFVIGLFAVLALVAGVVGDLVKVTAARNVALRETAAPPPERGLYDAAALAIRTTRAAIGRATVAWGWRAAVGLALVLAGARVASTAGAGGEGTLLVLVLVHQAILVARAALRASWLAEALRLVSRPPP